MTDAVRAALERIAALHPDTDSSEGMNEWGEAECFRKAQQIADAALAGPRTSHDRQPEGWVMVPVEPTADMRNAFHAVTDDDALLFGASASRWRAMLSAAPKPGDKL